VNELGSDDVPATEPDGTPAGDRGDRWRPSWLRLPSVPPPRRPQLQRWLQARRRRWLWPSPFGGIAAIALLVTVVLAVPVVLVARNSQSDQRMLGAAPPASPAADPTIGLTTAPREGVATGPGSPNAAPKNGAPANATGNAAPNNSVPTKPVPGNAPGNNAGSANAAPGNPAPPNYSAPVVPQPDTLPTDDPSLGTPPPPPPVDAAAPQGDGNQAPADPGAVPPPQDPAPAAPANQPAAPPPPAQPAPAPAPATQPAPSGTQPAVPAKSPTGTRTSKPGNGLPTAPGGPKPFVALTGPGCQSTPDISYHAAYRAGKPIKKQAAGGWSHNGCNGAFWSIPMSGSTKKDDPNTYAEWWFHTGKVKTGACSIWTYVPKVADDRAVGGDPAIYQVLRGQDDPKVIGTFPVMQTDNRGKWVYGGAFALSGGQIAVKLTDRGDGHKGARLAAAQILIRCTR
jgi:hypothetical protein